MGIEVKNVSKRFRETTALDNVSVTFGDDKIFGLLGNNGAGKTTLLGIITGRIFADSGDVLIDGENAAGNDAARGKIFLMGEQNMFPDDMKVKAAFEQAKLYLPGFDASYASTLSERFGLSRRSKITSLSTGYASIFRLIMALAANTPYMLLDEPVLGLDAQHRDLFYKLLIEKYSEHPCTVVISTHLISEVSRLIEHTVIIRDGAIIRDMPRDDLLAGAYTISGPAGAVNDYTADKYIISSTSLGGLKTVSIQGSAPAPGSLPAGLEAGKIDLQDFFISLMNGEDAKR